MPVSETPCLSLSIQRLAASGSNRYVIWVINAPYPSGYVLHDCVWPETLTQAWQSWREMFSLRGLPQVPHVSSVQPLPTPPPPASPEGNTLPYGVRLMQSLGVNLWQWLFDGPIEASINRSQGMAFGRGTPLRLRLEVRDPELIALPWEIMQAQMGRSVISIASDQILFSRTTSEVEPLPPLRLESGLKVLLVLGQATDTSSQADPQSQATGSSSPTALNLEQEAAALEEILANHEVSGSVNPNTVAVPSQVDTLIQPTPAELIEHLETGKYNIFFYAGHGVPAPDGGLLLLGPGNALNGTELAQVLTRCRVTLAVFNACWGAQPDHANDQPLPRSSLAEVLIHHGVPAVLGMRDSITDQEALSFIRSFAQALRKCEPIDRAVALARQHLLMLYKFNQPAWTLPVLYMHPQFDGQLINVDGHTFQDVKEDPKGNNTIMPAEGFPSDIRPRIPMASLRLASSPPKAWPIRDGVIRVGSQGDNDLVLSEPGVSRYHAKIFYRDATDQPDEQPAYILQDVSRYGTFILGANGWRRIHQQEVSLNSGVQLKFGNPKGQALEFLIERPGSEGNLL